MSYNDKLVSHVQYYSNKLHWPIFPCKPRGKAPATPHGCKDATADPAQIATWWDGTYLYNVGFAEIGRAHV